MPAMLDDPTAPVIFRTSGNAPYPSAGSQLPLEIVPRMVTLRDRVTTATVIPFNHPDQVPLSLLSYLCDQLNREIEKGDTYPMIDAFPFEGFGPYWFGVFAAIMLLGDIQNADEVRQMGRQNRDWEKECLGSFYIKPNYPGRSSHVCNGGFLVTDGARNRGVGRLMGEAYLDWAPKLGYTYSVFNLVYETNVASCKIWDALGFKRIGRVKGCGNLKSYPGELVDAIMYGRELGQDEDVISEERFDKIRYYLKHGKYPNGADRAEKSRLRSAATHYKLLPAQGEEPEKLMLKGKEVISDSQTQYEIARNIHLKQHGGINKTTAAIAEKYHWVRIKETVSQVIRNCPECGEMNKGIFQRTEVRTNGSTRIGGLGLSTATQNRSPSPSQQLQEEAAQSHQAHQMEGPALASGLPTYSNGFDMPVDPQLMNMNDPSSLANLPPSPFLYASQSLPMPSLPALPEPAASPTIHVAPAANMSTSRDVEMDGTDEDHHTDRELRTRLTRAGYRSSRG